MPKSILFHKDHLWIKTDGLKAVIGMTGYGQKCAGDIAFVGLPQTGESIECGETLCTVESYKNTTPVCSPCKVKILAVNENLFSNPELLNSDPYGEGWLVEASLSSLPENLMTADEYEEYTKS